MLIVDDDDEEEILLLMTSNILAACLSMSIKNSENMHNYFYPIKLHSPTFPLPVSSPYPAHPFPFPKIVRAHYHVYKSLSMPSLRTDSYPVVIVLSTP